MRYLIVITLVKIPNIFDRNFKVFHFPADFLYSMTLSATHLSRLAEDLILYATKEFGYINLSHAFSTGSSLMPNKRNPDSLELVRATTGLLHGNLSGFITLLKGLPSSYNKDLQYDKKLLFESFNQLCLALDVTYGVVKTMKVNKERCHNSLSFDMLATDVAYYLVSIFLNNVFFLHK